MDRFAALVVFSPEMRDVVVVDDRLLYGVSAGDGGPAEGPQPPPRVPAHQPHLGYREAENIILPDSTAT